jgi:hypothetical protein
MSMRGKSFNQKKTETRRSDAPRPSVMHWLTMVRTQPKETEMSIYTKTARFDTGRPLTEDELRQQAPSIFAVTAHSSRSDRFKPIPTIDVLRALTREGFHPVGARQATARHDDRREYTKHLIRLRRFDNVEKHKVGDNVLEMLLKNANDGSSPYDLFAGLFRICCLNSMVAQTGTIDIIKVRHTGDVQTKVIEGTYKVLSEAQAVLAAPQDWSQLAMPREAQLAYAEAAHVLRFGDAEEIERQGEPIVRAHPIKPEQLLTIHRPEDNGRNLWSTFNVVQENVIRGGLHGVTRNAQGRRRNVTMRAVNGIDQDVKLNKALWVLSEKMAGLLKTAA